MESELKNQEDLLQQLKKLRAENELLEKHVFVLNECLSVNELKEKISILEKKKKQLNLLENTIGRLRAEIEPLKYLKSVLENKLLKESTTNTNKSQVCIGLRPINNDYIVSEIKQFHNSTKMPTDSNTKTNADLVSTKKLYDYFFPTLPKSVSDVNESSPDDCVQLLDQYDVVTDQEISNFTDKNHSQIQNAIEEPTISEVDRNKVQSKHESVVKNLDQKDFELQMKYEEKDSIKENAELSVKNLATIDSTNFNNHSSQDHEIDEKANESLKNVNVDKNVLNDIVEQCKILHEEVDETTNTNECCTGLTEKMENCKIPNANNSEINIDSFNGMNLKIHVLRGIYSLGYTEPTKLQKKVIVQSLNGRNIIVFAGSGTGRTMMFTIPLLQRIKTKLSDCQALVLVPTRDVAVYIQKIILSFGDFSGVNVCIGGDSLPKRFVIPHVIVGTPEEVYKMITRKSIRTECIQTVVINEVDKMLMNDGYVKLIKGMLADMDKNKLQVTLLVSEKLDHVLDIFMDSLRDPLVIINEDVQEENDINKSLPKQFFLTIEDDWKLNAFCDINSTLNMQKVIIFCNTLDRARILFESLIRLDYSVTLFHLEMSACDREVKLKMFSKDRFKMLITTDPIKGVQFQHADWIINYDLPSNPICYLNRIGKCIKQKKVVNLINQNELYTKSIIETYTKSYMIKTPQNIHDMLQY